MLCSSQNPCFGILFKQQMDKYDAPDYLPSIIFNSQGLIWNFTGKNVAISVFRQTKYNQFLAAKNKERKYLLINKLGWNLYL